MNPTDLKLRAQNKESGRSMIDLLGALFLMGVLSATSVLGIHYIQKKKALNDFLLDLSSESVYVSVQALNQRPQLKTSVSRTRNGYFLASDYKIPGHYDSFVLTVAGVPAEVCREILESRWELPKNVLINQEPAVSVAQCDSNKGRDLLEMQFEVSTALESGFFDPSKERCSQNTDCQSNCNGSCSADGFCVYVPCATGEMCVALDDENKTKMCVTPEQVEREKLSIWKILSTLVSVLFES